jgi:hypothetical protein
MPSPSLLAMEDEARAEATDKLFTDEEITEHLEHDLLSEQDVQDSFGEEILLMPVEVQALEDFGLTTRAVMDGAKYELFQAGQQAGRRDVKNQVRDAIKAHDEGGSVTELWRVLIALTDAEAGEELD